MENKIMKMTKRSIKKCISHKISIERKVTKRIIETYNVVRLTSPTKDNFTMAIISDIGECKGLLSLNDDNSIKKYFMYGSPPISINLVDMPDEVLLTDLT